MTSTAEQLAVSAAHMYSGDQRLALAGTDMTMRTFDAMSLEACLARYGVDEAKSRLYEMSERLAVADADEFPWMKPVDYAYFLHNVQAPIDLVDGQLRWDDEAEWPTLDEAEHRREHFLEEAHDRYFAGLLSPWEVNAFEAKAGHIWMHVDENGEEADAPQAVLDKAKAEIDEEYARIRRWKKTKKSKRDWEDTKR